MSEPKGIDFRSAALTYAAMGWAVFPLGLYAKLPAIKGGKGVKDATTDVAQIELWAKSYPRANVGLACGSASGFMVIDIDPRNGANQSLAALAAKGRAFPDCPIAKTGGGGVHMLFRHDERVSNSKNKLGPGIDVKSTGGYIVAAPSLVLQPDKSLGAYVWHRHPSDIPPPRLPIWVSSLLAPQERPAHIAHNFTTERTPSLSGIVNFVKTAPRGEANNRLYWAACKAAEMVRDRLVSDASASDQLLSAALSRNVPHKEAVATIRSGFNGRRT